jgi:hypothetical protein
MTERIWCWEKGNKKIYTKRIDIAEQAIKEGRHVTVFKNKSHIFKN